MESIEDPNKKAEEIIKINFAVDNMYVIGLKTLINRGQSLEDAVKNSKEGALKNEGFGQEHIPQIEEAARSIEKELKAKEKNNPYEEQKFKEENPKGTNLDKKF